METGNPSVLLGLNKVHTCHIHAETGDLAGSEGPVGGEGDGLADPLAALFDGGAEADAPGIGATLFNHREPPGKY